MNSYSLFMYTYWLPKKILFTYLVWCGADSLTKFSIWATCTRTGKLIAHTNSIFKNKLEREQRPAWLQHGCWLRGCKPSGRKLTQESTNRNRQRQCNPERISSMRPSVLRLYSLPALCRDGHGNNLSSWLKTILLLSKSAAICVLSLCLCIYTL